MDTTVKFSICIPNYNYAHYIGETIQSVLDQTYSNFEIIVADNASTDKSVEVVRSFGDDRIIVRENAYNVGFAPNLDKATEGASGDYMILLSSDDTMKPNALEEYARIIEEFKGLENDLVIMSACDIIDSDGNAIGSKNAKTGDVHKHLRNTGTERSGDIESYEGHHVLQGLLKGTFQPAGQFMATCYSRKLFEGVEGYRSIMSIWPDAHFSHKLLFENPQLVYCNRPLFSYRVHGANNLAATLKMSNIKALTDGYLFTQLYPADQLKEIGLSPADLKSTFVNNNCIAPAFWSMLKGNFARMFHSFFFGLASYPKLMFRNYRFYIILLMWPLTPLFALLYRLKRSVS